MKVFFVKLLLMSLTMFSKKTFATIAQGSVKGSLIVNPEATSKSLIWMHGLGDTPHGFADIFSHFARKYIS